MADWPLVSGGEIFVTEYYLRAERCVSSQLDAIMKSVQNGDEHRIVSGSHSLGSLMTLTIKRRLMTKYGNRFMAAYAYNPVLPKKFVIGKKN